MREALLDGGAEVEIDEADAARVRRSADDRERSAARLQTLDTGVVRECLHEDDAVRPARLDEADDAVRICGRGGEEERVVARARLLGRAGDERLLDGDELPLRRRKEERDRVRGAARQCARGSVGSVVQLLDCRQHPLANLGRHRALAAEDVGNRAERHSRTLSDVCHRRRPCGAAIRGAVIGRRHLTLSVRHCSLEALREALRSSGPTYAVEERGGGCGLGPGQCLECRADGGGAGAAPASRPGRRADPRWAPRRPAAGQPRGDDPPRDRAARARGHTREPSRRRGSVAGRASRHGLQRLGRLQVARGARLGDAATALTRARAPRGRDDGAGRRRPAARRLPEQLLAARRPRALERPRDGARALLRGAPDPGRGRRGT